MKKRLTATILLIGAALVAFARRDAARADTPKLGTQPDQSQQHQATRSQPTVTSKTADIDPGMVVQSPFTGDKGMVVTSPFTGDPGIVRNGPVPRSTNEEAKDKDDV